MKRVKDICISDSGMIYTILKSKKYFVDIRPTKAVINTISGPADLIEETDGFTDMKRVTKSHIPAVNVPTRIQNPKQNDVASTSKAHVRRGRPIGSKDKNSRKRKIEKVDMKASAPENVHNNNNDVMVEKICT
ncbi:hypothetical protein LIER_23992 [Lithospermum erythrorhizon]|uniref:Uncharacterized protein n=1 Tax=Lithospermum erythrorhizon TaxID=34254 RepID=A0AAV3QZQ2_LITER